MQRVTGSTLVQGFTLFFRRSELAENITLPTYLHPDEYIVYRQHLFSTVRAVLSAAGQLTLRYM